MWSLSFDDERVEMLGIDFAVNLRLGADFAVRISTLFLLAVGSDVAAQLEPEGDAVALAPVLNLARRQVHCIGATAEGRLDIEFEGARLTVLPDEYFEAWWVNGPDGFMIGATPGGAVSIFDRDSV